MSEWQRPSRCGDSAACIEIRQLADSVEIRSSRHAAADPYGVALATADEWAAFIAAVKAGEYDAAR